MSVFGETNPEGWEYVLIKRRSASRKRVQGFDSALSAAIAAQAEMQRSTVWDDFRVYAVPGGDVEFL